MLNSSFISSCWPKFNSISRNSSLSCPILDHTKDSPSSPSCPPPKNKDGPGPHMRILQRIQNILLNNPVISIRKPASPHKSNDDLQQTLFQNSSDLSLRRHHSLEKSTRRVLGVPLYHFMDRTLPNSILSILIRLYQTSNDPQSVFVFRLSPLKTATSMILEQIEENPDEPLQNIDDIPVKTLAAALKSFLRDIPNGLLEIGNHFNSCDGSEECAKKTALEAMQRISKENRILLVYLLVLLKRISDDSEVNQMDAHALASVLVPAFGFQIECQLGDASDSEQHSRVQHLVDIVEYLISKAPQIIEQSVYEDVVKQLERRIDTLSSVSDPTQVPSTSSNISESSDSADYRNKLILSKRDYIRRMSHIPSVSMQNLAEQHSFYVTPIIRDSLFNRRFTVTSSCRAIIECEQDSQSTLSCPTPDRQVIDKASSKKPRKSKMVVNLAWLTKSETSLFIETPIRRMHSRGGSEHDLLHHSTSHSSRNSSKKKSIEEISLQHVTFHKSISIESSMPNITGSTPELCTIDDSMSKLISKDISDCSVTSESSSSSVSMDDMYREDDHLIPDDANVNDSTAPSMSNKPLNRLPFLSVWQSQSSPQRPHKKGISLKELDPSDRDSSPSVKQLIQRFQATVKSPEQNSDSQESFHTETPLSPTSNRVKQLQEAFEAGSNPCSGNSSDPLSHESFPH